MVVHKDEERGTWYCQFYYKDWQGKLHRTMKRGFTYQREAKQYEQDFLARQTGGASMRFSVLIDTYKDHLKKLIKEGKFKQATYDKRLRQIELHILPFFQNMPIGEITPEIVRQWQDNIVENFSPITQRHIHGYLSTIFSYAVRYKKLASNPCREAGAIGNLAVRKNPDDLHFWTIDEFNQFLDYLPKVKTKTPTEELRTAYMTLFFTGIRLGELMALNIGDYNPNNKTLIVIKSMNERRSITDPKTTKSKRVIPLSENLCSCLDQHIKKLQDNDRTDKLFQFGRQVLQVNIKAVSEAAGLQAIHIHDLRHSHASMLINAGLPILAISERLGHKSVQITLNIYGHLYKQTADVLADYLNQYIKK